MGLIQKAEAQTFLWDMSTLIFDWVDLVRKQREAQRPSWEQRKAKLIAREEERRNNLLPIGYKSPAPSVQPEPKKVPLAERMAKAWTALQRARPTNPPSRGRCGGTDPLHH